MQRVVAEFLPFFSELRADGASWTQIAALLALAGVRSRSGKPVTDGVLRAMVSRAERVSTNDREARETLSAKRQIGISETRPRPPGLSHQRTPETPSRKRKAATDTGLSDVRQRILRTSTLRDAGSGSGAG